MSPKTVFRLNLILPTLSTVWTDRTCCCLSEIACLSCMPSAFHLIHNPHFCILDRMSFCRSTYGSQQADPLGLLLRCNAIHPLISSPSSDLSLGYLDDFTLHGWAPECGHEIHPSGDGGGEQIESLYEPPVNARLFLHPDWRWSTKRFCHLPLPGLTMRPFLGLRFFLVKFWSVRCEDLWICN